MTARTTRTWLATFVAFALLAAACGDDDSESLAPADESTATDNQPDTETQPDTVEVDEAALQQILDEWRNDVDAFGATLSIRMPGHDDIHLASGIDDRDTETPMPTDGTYTIGTMTRTFVAATALQLVDEGRLSLDEPVEPWLPELPNTDEITLAMLLDQTSGLPQQDDAADTELISADLTRSFTPDEVLAIQLEQPPGAPPGEEFGVGIDTGYVAAGLLIERELDQDLAAIIEERFAAPLSLDDTFLSDGTTKPTRHGWFSLDGNPDRPLDFLDLPHEAYATFSWASRNMISSPPDMLDWGEALYTGAVLGEDTTATMLEMRNTASPIQHYGLGASGFCLDQTGCDPDDVDLLGHLGGSTANESLVAHHPDSGTTLVVHTNVNFGDDYVRNLVGLDAAVLDQLGLT